jgi:methylthioribulose-1-phosphate dehydratase
MIDSTHDLLQAIQFVASKGWCPATGGNFSLRDNNETMLISASGKDKAKMGIDDFVSCDLAGIQIAGVGKPSAEAVLHGMLYQLSDEIGCVLHTHSVYVTALSLYKHNYNAIVFQGYEMQKTVNGFDTHEDSLSLLIEENDQNMCHLAERVKEHWHEIQPAHGVIVRGHGLYSWGKTVAEAQRHMEGLEFLVECEFAKARLP